MAGCGEMWGASFGDIVCPKPRRLGINDHMSPSRWLTIRQAEISDSKAGTELLDLILSKGGCGDEKSSTQMACSPPFFYGSPPSRTSNPLIQDSQFGSDESGLILSTPPSPTACKGGPCARGSYNPAMVRVEGFNCLSRDRRSISAVA